MILKGLDKVLKNLNKAIEKQQKQTKAGVFEACLIVKADAVKLASIQLGNLRSSAFVKVTDLPADTQSASFSGDDKGKLTQVYSAAQSIANGIVNQNKWSTVGVVAFGAYYSLYVHEMPSSYNFNQGENKFLEKSVNKNKKRVLNAIAKHAKI